jgi:hypothetical protein
MAVVEFKNERGFLEYHVNDISSAAGFDDLVEFIQSFENGTLLKKDMGPGTKLALFDVDGFKIQLVFSDQIGNYFFSIDSSGNFKAKLIAVAIEKRINECNVSVRRYHLYKRQ